MDEARTHLAILQRTMLEALIAGTLDSPRVHDHNPILLDRALTPVHRDNLDRKIGFYFPRFHSERPSWDDPELAPPAWNPTTFPHEAYLERLFSWLLVRVASWKKATVWTELLLIERAHWLAKNHVADTVAELVTATKNLPDPLEWQSPGYADHGPFRFVRLRTNLLDLQGNTAWRPHEACPFGRPRLVVSYRSPSSGTVRDVVYSSPKELGVSLCFNR